MTDFIPFPFHLEPFDQRAVQLRLVTLKTDLTVEIELRHFIGDSMSARQTAQYHAQPHYKRRSGDNQQP